MTDVLEQTITSFSGWGARARRLLRRGPDRPMRPSVSSSLTFNTHEAGPGRVEWSIVLAALPDPALLLNQNLRVIEFNSKAAELFPHLSRGLHVTSVSRNPELREGISLMQDGAEQLAVALNERVPLERTLRATLSRLPKTDADPSAADLMIILQDLSEARQIERTRTDFVANASHELRTPLASIIGFIETLQVAARHDPVARDKFLGVMSLQAQRMKRLVDDLMSLSRVEMHTHIMPRDEVDLNGILDDLRQSLEPLARQEDVRIEIVGLERPAIVLGDRDELIQVFQNLIHNGIRHGNPGGLVQVWVETGGQPAAVRVHVMDDGPGIAPQHLPRLTERFYRVDVATSRRKEGTGLGLAIAKHVINRHRGELQIASELGKGSTFTVELPEAVTRQS
jgi:two-component system, OmpR family, phosphate regulon sensor histidine kinase PhoR